MDGKPDVPIMEISKIVETINSIAAKAENYSIEIQMHYFSINDDSNSKICSIELTAFKMLTLLLEFII